ncbi:MAG: WYL domain-containing protein [Salibacteraceae bacterium]|nr:WYL domain-containing protein [Salibacteraceae bacterium]
MPLNKNAYNRYIVIDSLLRNKMRPYPTMQELIAACNERLSIDTKLNTIQKDIERMKMPPPDGFNAPIYYERYHKGYMYTDPDFKIGNLDLTDADIASIKESLALVQSIGAGRIDEKFGHAMQKVLATVAEVFDQPQSNAASYLQTMSPPISRGFAHFELFSRACRERIPLSFVHYGYKKRRFTAVELHPFLIKEFDNKWYLFGYSENHQEVRHFGFDRIYSPLLLNKPFARFDQQATFDLLAHAYGVFPIPDKKKQRITLEVSSLITHYFEAYPIHNSQQIKKHEDGTAQITLELVPTIELARLILWHGYHVQQIAPKWFADFTKALTL